MSASISLAIAVGVALLAHALQIATSLVAGRRVRRVEKVSKSAKHLPSVALLVPIAHVDPYLRSAIDALFRLECRHVKLVFCLTQASDVQDLIEEVAGRYPWVSYSVLLGRAAVSVNPKLDNLGKALAEPGAEWCCIVDANIIVPPDCLKRLGAAVRNNVAVVSAIPLGTCIDGFWSDVEAAFLNTYQARLQLFADTLGAGFAHGKIMLFRSADLRGWGGAMALASDVAEDAAITKLARGSGRCVKLIDGPVPQPLGRRSFVEVWRRQIRWAQLRRQSFPRLFVGEPLSTSLLPAAAAGAAAEISGIGFLLGFLTSLTLWVAVETALAAWAGWRRGPRYALACLVRDGMAFAIWLLAWGRHRYVWRGNTVDMRRLRQPP